MASPSLALIDVFAEIPDFRQSQARRYPLTAVLSLTVAALLCSYRSDSAIAEWGRNYGHLLTQALGFAAGKTPCASTLYTILSRLDKDDFEVRLGRWAETLSQQPVAGAEPDSASLSEAGVALDGKSLHGSKKQGAMAAHLLSALSQRLGLTLF